MYYLLIVSPLIMIICAHTFISVFFPPHEVCYKNLLLPVGKNGVCIGPHIMCIIVIYHNVVHTCLSDLIMSPTGPSGMNSSGQVLFSTFSETLSAL